MTTKVFITHSSMDKNLADALVRALSIGTDPADIFCSSVDGTGIPVGEEFTPYLQERLRETSLVIPLITPAYLDSLFCMWELGATWMTGIPIFPMKVPDVEYSTIPSLLASRHIAALDDRGLDSLFQRVAETVERPPDMTRWSAERAHLMTRVPDILIESRIKWAGTSQAKQRRAARASDAAVHLHQTMHALRDAAFVRIEHNEIAGNENAFLSHLRRAMEALSRCFRETTDGRSCRVTLKEVVADADTQKIYAQDLVRSEGRAGQTKDLISLNTDFESILAGDKNFFISNDLAELRSSGNYVNSHVPSNAPLPYLSTIVWPVRKTVDYPDLSDFIGAVDVFQDLVAFLCVDSVDSGVFGPTEVQFGAAVADALYAVLKPSMY